MQPTAHTSAVEASDAAYDLCHNDHAFIDGTGYAAVIVRGDTALRRLSTTYPDIFRDSYRDCQDENGWR